ncbi:MAG: ABC transporter substrate-binding protein [Candidatus Rokuibacteriota bacterium]|nr:MAG: ABC transporter substrate-binding protein [Candidatus Rokubacteria bacterium]
MTPRVINPAIIALGLILSPFNAGAQSATPMPQVGVLDPGTEGADLALRAYALRDAMRELGWVHGKNVALKLRFANRNPEQLASLAEELVKEKVDVIAAVGTDAALAARRATATIPVVMVGVGDPVRVGLVQNLGRPEGNVTGVSLINIELWGKRLEFLREVLPRLSRLAVLHQDTAGARSSIKELRAVGSRLGLELRTVVFRDREALPDQFAEMRAARAEALAIVPSPVLDEVRGRVAELALKHRLPTLLAFPEYVEAGGLMGYGPSLAGTHRRAAYYVDKLLKGAKPVDLPVEQPTKIELVINLKTARALSITIPRSLLYRADRILE